MDNTIPYHTIVEVSPISKWEPGQKYCLRVATIECHYLIQVCFLSFLAWHKTQNQKQKISNTAR